MALSPNFTTYGERFHAGVLLNSSLILTLLLQTLSSMVSHLFVLLVVTTAVLAENCLFIVQQEVLTWFQIRP